VAISYDARMPFEILRKGCGPKITNVLRNFHKSTARLIVRLKIAAL
jgi:hypothetical protein